MTGALVTCVQLFCIGLGFGSIGPCFLTCTPILVTYIAGTRKGWRRAMFDVAAFLAGRLVAYCLLGALAGISGGLIRRFAGPTAASVGMVVGGLVSIGLSVMVFAGKGFSSGGACGKSGRYAWGSAGALVFGFVVGVSPCAPLAALLFELSLMSKGVWDGIMYAASFGLGTLLSGMVVIGSAAGLFAWLPGKVLRTPRAVTALSVACAALLLVTGAVWIAEGLHVW